MKNQLRIKLEVRLKDHDRGMNADNHELIIKVLKKDNRFNVAPSKIDGQYKALIFTTPGGFVINTNSHLFKGYMGEEFFTLPNKKYLNRKIIKGFPTDYMRKAYLKKLYTSLMAWAEQWGDFSKEPTANFKTMGNKWYIYITK